MSTNAHIALAAHEFERLKRLADHAMEQLPADAFFAKLAEDDNSIGVICKHVTGNLISRWTNFLCSDGEKPDRRRDMEFIIQPEDSRESLLAKWEEGWAALFNALQPLQPSDLDRTVTIRGERLTVLQAVNRQLTHYAYHVGQIVYLAKHYSGAQWKSLSIPVGESDRFNQAQRERLDEAKKDPANARLENPSLKRKDSYLSLVREFRDRGEPLVPFPLKFPNDDFEAFLGTMEDCSKGLGIPEGFVSHETFWLVAGDEVVAVSNLRHKLTDALRKEGGHIGYGVRPSARRKGYATKILAETLRKAEARGITDILVTCDKTNLGSAKTIINNGGVLESEEHLKDHRDVIQRYRIRL